MFSRCQVLGSPYPVARAASSGERPDQPAGLGRRPLAAARASGATQPGTQKGRPVLLLVRSIWVYLLTLHALLIFS
eukprot:COSAG01_NODE_26_length_36857_cov_31.426166_30_plen_76_part_00